MSKSLAAALVLVILTSSCMIITIPVSEADVQDNLWVEKAPMPTARGYLETAVVNGRVYAIGGSGPIGTNEEYDPAADKWITKSPMPNPAQSFAIAVFQDKIYCFGGLNGSMSTMNQVYDPATDSWENKAPMPTARYGLQANVVDGKIYLMGGVKLKGYNQGSQLLNNTEVYEPLSDTWTAKASMPNPEGYVSAVVDSKIDVIGEGLTQIYSPNTDSWKIGASPLENITKGGNGQSASASATTGLMAPKRVYVYDGSSLQVYDPANNNWMFGAPPPISRQYLGIANVNDTLFFIGGFSISSFGMYQYYSTNEQYTPIGYGRLGLPNALSSQITMEIAVTIIIAVLFVLSILFYRRHRNLHRDKTLRVTLAPQMQTSDLSNPAPGKP